MAQRAQYENSNDIGVFAKLTNSYCLTGLGGSQNFYSVFEAELADHIPCVQTSIGGNNEAEPRLTWAAKVAAVKDAAEKAAEEKAVAERARAEKAAEQKAAAEKAVACYYEEGVNAKRPLDKVYRPWVDRMYEQTKDGLDALETMVEGPWVMGDTITQADVSIVCFWDFIIKNRPETAPGIKCPKLEEISLKANALKEFAATIPG